MKMLEPEEEEKFLDLVPVMSISNKLKVHSRRYTQTYSLRELKRKLGSRLNKYHISERPELKYLLSKFGLNVPQIIYSLDTNVGEYIFEA